MNALPKTEDDRAVDMSLVLGRASVAAKAPEPVVVRAVPERPPVEDPIFPAFLLNPGELRADLEAGIAAAKARIGELYRERLGITIEANRQRNDIDSAEEIAVSKCDGETQRLERYLAMAEAALAAGE